LCSKTVKIDLNQHVFIQNSISLTINNVSNEQYIVNNKNIYDKITEN